MKRHVAGWVMLWIVMAASGDAGMAAEVNGHEVEIYQPIDASISDNSGTPYTDIDIAVTHAVESPVIDGKLDDAAWRDAVEVTGFQRRNGTVAAAQSYVKLLYDKKYLYLGCKFDEPFMEKLVAQFDQHDLNIYADDCFELFLDTSGSADTFYHFIINSLGAVYDTRGGDKKWSSQNIQTAGAKHADCWILEVALPFVDLNISPVGGDVWGIKLCRERKTATNVECDSALPRQHGANNKYQYFAKLIFTRTDKSKKLVSMNYREIYRPMPGYNMFPLEIINHTGTGQHCIVELKGIDKAGLALCNVEQNVDLVPSGRMDVEIPFVVAAADDLSSIVLTLRNNDYDVLSRQKYAFPHLGGIHSLADVERMHARLEANFALHLPANHPLTQSAGRSVTKFRAELNGFYRMVANAITEKRTITFNEWRSFQAHVRGFYDWQLKNSVLYWQPDIWGKLSPFDFPVIRNAKPELFIKVAGNEIGQDGLTLSGLALTEPLRVQIFIEHLTRADGNECLQPDDVKIYEIVSIRDQMKRLVDDPLVEHSGNIFTILPGKSTHLWLEVWARSIFKRSPVDGEEAEVLPGKYSGTILIRPLDVLESPVATWVKIPISVEVMPFRLPDTKDMPIDTFLFTTSVMEHNVFIPQVNMVRDLHKHRINWVMCDWWRLMPRAISEWKNLNNENLKEYTGLRNNDEMLKEAKRLGMKVMYAWNNTGNPFVCARVAEHMQELGFNYNEFACQGKDEFGHKHIPLLLDFHKHMEKLDPYMQFMETFTSVPPPYGATPDDIEALTPYTKIWINHMSRFWPPTHEQRSINLGKMRELQQKYGCIIGVYQCGQGMRGLPIIDYYRLYPWKAWALDLDLISYWTYVSWGKNSTDTFSTLEHAQEGFVHYGNGGTLIPTKRYEAFREGLEDYCYLYLLKTGIVRAKTEGRDVRDAETVLEQAIKDALHSENMRDFTVIRERLAGAIMSLSL